MLPRDGRVWARVPTPEYSQTLADWTVFAGSADGYTFGDHELFLGPMRQIPEMVHPVEGGLLEQNLLDWTTKPGAMVEKVYTHYSYSYATQLVTLDDEGQIEKITAAHDAGKIFNPTMFEGQIEGALHMGLGYAISEKLELENGRPKSTRLRDCGILRAWETPELEVVGVEVPDPYGPYGAKGVGEIGLVPTAGAVANALYQFDGVRRQTLPMMLKRKRKSTRQK